MELKCFFLSNVQYIYFGRTENLKSWSLYEREGNESHSQLITKKF